MDSYRGRRSPERGGRYSRDGPGVDSYMPAGGRGGRRSPPGGYRRRPSSRSPPPRNDSWAPHYRDGPDSYAPPRRNFPPPDRYVGRPRSPPGGLKRGRDFSPPPAKRERLASPDGGYGRPRSPPRRGYSPPPNRNSYRPRSRSPPPPRRMNDEQYRAPAYRRRSPSPRSAPHSGRDSGANSRRSSPPASYRRPVDNYGPPDSRAPPPPRSPLYRQDSYDDRARTPPRNDYDMPPKEEYRDPAPPQADFRDRPPPTGPASRYANASPGSSQNPNTTPITLSAHNRPGGSSIPPSGPSSHSAPRGGYGGGLAYRGRGGPRGDFSSPRGDFSSPRGGRGWGGPPGGYGRGRGDYPPRDDYSYSRGPPSSRYDRPGYDRQPSSDYPPRGGGGYRGDRANPAFTGGNSTSRTVPQSVRFDVNGAMAELPKIKETGERLPPLHDGSKAEKLEEEAARLRKLIDDRDVLRRQLGREWEGIERERKEAELRGGLAEERLGELVGEAGGVAY